MTMNVTITIDGVTIALADEDRWALRQACAVEQHAFLKRHDNVKTAHMKEQYMRQALFLERLANAVIEPIAFHETYQPVRRRQT